jgi:hypothetical protein
MRRRWDVRRQPTAASANTYADADAGDAADDGRRILAHRFA